MGSRKANDKPRPEVELSGQYVYGVIRDRGPLNVGPIGIGPTGSAVALVRHRELAAVVSDVAQTALEPTRENVLAHERVNQRVLRDHTLVPMSFGTIFKSRRDVVELLRSAHQTFSQALDAIADSIELGLEVFWDLPQEQRRVAIQARGGRARRHVTASDGRESLATRMELGRRVDATLRARADDYAAKILTGLRSVSVASRVSDVKSEQLVLKAALLIRRDQEAAFERRLSAIDRQHRELTFRLTGPWPPYNFVTIRMQVAKGEE